MRLNKYKLVLASKSPRRKELLGWLNIPFVIDSPDIKEVTDESDPTKMAEDLASLKGEALFKKYKESEMLDNPLIVASDTIVRFEDKVFGKPRDREDAKRMLTFLAGKTHQVITAVYLGRFEEENWTSMVFSCESEVTFDKITKDILEIYLDSKEYFDKAGSYGIQGQGLLFISKIKGSYSNVVGFPLSHFVKELKKFLGYPNDSEGKWRDLFE